VKKRRERPLVRVTINLDQEDYHLFEDLARNDDRSAASLIRLAMREFLENQLTDTSQSTEMVS
jgi:hypothetical protein